MAAELDQDGTSDVDIVIRMRTGSPMAFEQFVDRFHPVLLDYGRRAGVDQSERDELVNDVLSDVALHFLTPGIAMPRNPRMYLITAFRNRLLNGERERARQEKAHSGIVREAAIDSEYADDGEIAAGCSEAVVTESHGPGWERTSLPPALERLSVHLNDALSPEEHQLLIAVAENIPQRQVAEWLGVSHTVARKRLERVRSRMMQVAMRYTNLLEADDAQEVRRFFRRCGAWMGAKERSTDVGPTISGGGSEHSDETETKGSA